MGEHPGPARGRGVMGPVELGALGIAAAIAGAAIRPAERAPVLPRRAPADASASVPERVLRIQRALEGGATSAGDLHFKLRPLLRSIAAARLGARGIDLDGRPAEARRLLGDELWELVRADRPRPGDMFARGPELVGVQRLLERLEAL
jgi:hypothetical protein